jgi:predicted ATPase
VGPVLPSGTVTFLFTDVEGSTQLLQRLGAADYGAALADHRRAIREACVREGGVEVDTQGDAFFFAFPTAPAALAAASALTEALASGQVQVRVGVHTGTPLLTDEGYVGDDVHRAARIAGAGHGGQVLVSSSTATLVDFDLRDLGEHRLKDLAAPERVFQLGALEFPPLKTLHQTNLPVPSTPFLGREQELEQVLGLLSRRDVRLLTVTGPGGTGKTRLAAHAAGLLAGDYPHGVWWVPLATLRDPKLVLESAAQILGAKVDVASHVGDDRLLLLFDNFEHLIGAAPDFVSLLAACPNVDLLVTSREPLHLSGEQQYPVPPFAHEEALAFFAARARAAKPDFEADESVSEICRRLEELPLALELAAARVKALSTKQILDRLEQRLPLLAGGAVDAPERQRTLRATIEWSYALLSPAEQELFARLSIFAGGCTLEAAEEVAGADLETLQSLIEKSLVRYSNERYWMLETIREYAGARLEDPTRHELNKRHADHFVALAEEAAPHLRDQPKQWLDRLEAEHANLRLALECLQGAEGPRLLRLAVNITRFWLMRGYLGEGRRWLDRALAVAPTAPVEDRFEALLGAFELARIQGDYEASKVQGRRALDLARATSDPYQIGRSLNAASLIASEQGDFDTASNLLEEALEALRLANDKRSLVFAMNNRGYIALNRGDCERALALCEESFSLASEICNEAAMAQALLNVAFASLGLGRLAEASAALLRGLQLAAGLGFRDWVGYALEGLAALSAARGRMDRALRLVASAGALRSEIGTQLDPVEQQIHDETLDAVRKAFSPQAIEAAFRARTSQTLTEAVEYALAAEQ